MRAENTIQAILSTLALNGYIVPETTQSPLNRERVLLNR